MLDGSVHVHVGAEGDALDLGGDVNGADAAGDQRGDDVQERGLGECERRQVGRAGDLAHVGGALESDAEELLHDGGAAVTQALAVALVEQKVVVVDGQDLAHA